MPLNVRHSIIHSFDKEKQGDSHNVIKKTALLDNDLQAVQALVGGISVLLGKHSNNQAWGRFGSDGREGPVPGVFGNFSTNLNNAQVFLDMTHLIVDQLVIEADKKPLATGGHILFSLYDNDAGRPVMLVAMIKQKGGVTLDEDYVPVGIVEIDMSKLRQAASIDVQHYLDDVALDEEVIDEAIDRDYLSFLSPKTSGETSGYFITAIGCVVGISSARATDKVVKAVEKFFADNADLSEYKKAAKENVIKYLQDQLASNEAASLEALCAEVARAVPGELAESVNPLFEFLNGPKYKIPDQFDVNENVLKKYIKVSLDNPRMNLKFDRSILGITAESQVHYRKNDRSLTIKDLPPEFIAKLDQTLQNG
ncbi:MAG: nucleoid-associated protein [Pseudomonadota bacterium]